VAQQRVSLHTECSLAYIMANPVIKVKRSSVAGKVPAPTQLERGELAVNSYDGKVYIIRDQFSTGIGTTTHTLNPWDEYTIGSKIAYAGIASAQQFTGNLIGSINSSGISTFGGNISVGGNITVTGTVDGADIASMNSKLSGIEASATADQTAAEIRALVESASDSNVFTDADHSKLNGIEASATADQSASEIRALVESASDSNVFTDADHSKLNGIEASATADQTAAEILTLIKTVDGSGSGLDADTLDGISSASFVRSDAADTVAGALTFSSDATFNADIEMVNTDADSSAGPIISLWRNSASPADADYLGQIKFQGENDAGQKIVYSKITGKILDASDGTEDGILEFAFQKAGSNNISGRFRSDSLQLLNGTNFTVAGDSTFTGKVFANHGVQGNINSSGISTISGFTFPSTDGSEDQALVTDGNGSLSFKTLSGGGGATGAATTISTGVTTATQGQTSFTAPNVFDDGEQATAFSTQVFLNGVKQRLGASNDYQLSAPQTVTFNSGVTLGDDVTIVVYFGHTLEEEFFTATQGQKDFTLAGSLAAAKNYKVYLNGVRLRNTVDYSASSAVVLNQIAQAGDQVDIVSDQAEDRLTAVQNQTSFAPSDSNTTSDNMQVYMNGILLRETEDWSIGSPSVTILDADGLNAGDHLDVVVRRS